jgi:UDP-glucose 4-epimerase
MRYLITGGAGFIGSHLARRLLNEGHEVRIIDDFSTGSVDNITDLIGREGFDCNVGAVSDRSLVAPLVACADRVFHLAAVVGVMRVFEAPGKALESNVFGTETVLTAAARWKKRILITSSSEVYGPNNARSRTGLREEDSLPPEALSSRRWTYALSKRINETRALALWRGTGLPVVIARLFNTIGPGQSGEYGMVVPRFVDQARRGAALTVFGDGSQSRCFTWVGDTVECLIRLMENPAATGHVVNVGSREDITIRDLALTVAGMTPGRSKISFLSYKNAYGPGFEDTRCRKPDTARLEKLTRFVPETPLSDVLARLLEKAPLPLVS